VGRQNLILALKKVSGFLNSQRLTKRRRFYLICSVLTVFFLLTGPAAPFVVALLLVLLFLGIKIGFTLFGAPLAPYFPPGRRDFQTDECTKAVSVDEASEQSQGLKRKIAKARDKLNRNIN
jgi:hypothetical protein